MSGELLETNKTSLPLGLWIGPSALDLGDCVAIRYPILNGVIHSGDSAILQKFQKVHSLQREDARSTTRGNLSFRKQTEHGVFLKEFLKVRVNQFGRYIEFEFKLHLAYRLRPPFILPLSSKMWLQGCAHVLRQYSPSDDRPG